MAGSLLLTTVLVLATTFLFRVESVTQEQIPIAVVDFSNETGEPELDGLSGMLITALDQSQRLSVLTRAHMFDILGQMGKTGITRLDETLGREICRRAEVKVLAVPSIYKLGDTYTIDLKVIDIEKNRYFFTAREDGKGQENILTILDNLSERTRKELREKRRLFSPATEGSRRSQHQTYRRISITLKAGSYSIIWNSNKRMQHLPGPSTWTRLLLWRTSVARKRLAG